MYIEQHIEQHLDKNFRKPNRWLLLVNRGYLCKFIFVRLQLNRWNLINVIGDLFDILNIAI